MIDSFMVELDGYVDNGCMLTIGSTEAVAGAMTKRLANMLVPHDIPCVYSASEKRFSVGDFSYACVVG